MKKERLKIKTERIEFFSDAVIAIIITLMVLDIHLPKIEDNATSAQIFHQLKGVLPNIFAFMISFAVLGVYWTNHHQFYKAVEYTDWKLLYYNLHFLFWCSLIPLTTSLLAENYDKPAITMEAMKPMTPVTTSCNKHLFWATYLRRMAIFFWVSSEEGQGFQRDREKIVQI